MSPSDDSRAEFFSSEESRKLLKRFDPGRIPRHVAIVMDGNGRWAERRGLPRLAGHRAGAKAVREAIATAIELGIEYLTIYSFSSENWARPANEVAGLMDLFVEILERELDNLTRMGVRVLVAGRREDLPPQTDLAFRRTEARTADRDTLTLVVALNYGGRTEIVDAARSIARDVVAGALSLDDVDESALAARLYTPGIPDPDLLMRTSGELRVSNFLLWQIAYSEFWVTQTLWPDFDRTEFLRGVLDFQQRERRFGSSR